MGAYSQRGSLTDNLRARLKKAIKDTGTGVVFRPKRDDDDLTYQLQNETDLGNIVNQYKKTIAEKKMGTTIRKRYGTNVIQSILDMVKRLLKKQQGHKLRQ